MRMLITHFGPVSQVLPATALFKPILKRYPDAQITFVVRDEYKYIFQFIKNIKVISKTDLMGLESSFHVLINLYPQFNHKDFSAITIDEPLGFGFTNKCDEDDPFYDLFLDYFSKGNDDYKNLNIFQAYFLLSSIKWKGEGYNLGYHPKAKMKKGETTGIAVANYNLRDYVSDNIELPNNKIINIPYKRNLLKRMDEINKCKRVVTDDLTTLHLSLYLRKHVYFLKTFPIKERLEMFGSGEILEIPRTLF